MAGKRDTNEFKVDAVKRVTDNGYKIAYIAKDLGLYTLDRVISVVIKFLYI